MANGRGHPAGARANPAAVTGSGAARSRRGFGSRTMRIAHSPPGSPPRMIRNAGLQRSCTSRNLRCEYKHSLSRRCHANHGYSRQYPNNRTYGGGCQKPSICRQVTGIAYGRATAWRTKSVRARRAQKMGCRNAPTPPPAAKAQVPRRDADEHRGDRRCTQRWFGLVHRPGRAACARSPPRNSCRVTAGSGSRHATGRSTDGSPNTNATSTTGPTPGSSRKGPDPRYSHTDAAQADAFRRAVTAPLDEPPGATAIGG